MTKHDVVLRARGITKVYSEGKGSSNPVLEGLDLEIRRGSLVVIRGENGCGKSTLLRILGLVDRDFEGHLAICGVQVSGNGRQLAATKVEDLRAQNIGFVFQDDLLHPLLSLRENSELPARIHRWPKRRITEHIDRLTKLIFHDSELDSKVMQRRKQTVSGGQRQRAAILRALAHRPNLIVADEPTASLDPEVTAQVIEIFKELCETEDATILVASHDPIFRNVGESYELSEGKLEPQATVGEEEPQACEVSQLPGCPLRLQAKIALREALGNPLFAMMIAAAMAAGLFQLNVLWSIQAGTEKVLEEVINKGSRLDRISVEARARMPGSTASGLPSEETIEGLDTEFRAVERREILLRVNDSRGRERQETAFGLIFGDPEIEKLEFREGGPFDHDAHALAVLITERSVERLFGASAIGEAATGKRVRIRFRRYLTPEDWEEKKLDFVIQGVVDRAEAGRNFYLPQDSLRAIATWKVDLEAELADLGGRLALSHEEGAEVPAWEHLDVYFDRLDEVLPAASYFERQGFATTADLFRYKWVLDTQRLVNWTLLGILAMIVILTGLLIISNVVSGVRLKRKEIAVLKLMGMKDRDVVSIFVLSVLMCALLGGALGFGAGSLAVNGLRDYISATYPESSLGQALTSISWTRVAYALLICSGVSIIFTVGSARWTARKEAAWELD